MPEMIYPDGTQTTASPTPPDVTYIRTREDLLQYEDARFNSLILAVPNYYIVENDQSLWGDILRAVAQELARLEYDYAYDIVNKTPIYLTPPDIKRRWAANLYINRLYPTTDPVQYDLDYKMMLVNLLPAYGLGATVQSLEDIIFAYTGLHIEVLELYKFIGQGFFDQSDRNAISVSVNVGGNNPLDDIQQLNQLQAITNALYGAIDLGKPAHVGLEFKTVFGTNEDVHSFVSQGTSSYYNITNPNGITDKLRIIVRLVERPPLNPMLWQAPDLLASTPKTGLGPSQVLAWQPKTNYVVGQMIVAGGFFQVVTTAGTSGANPPTFNPTFGAHTTDHTVTWTNAGTAVGIVLYPTTSVHNPAPEPWVPFTAYSFGSLILAANGYVQEATTVLVAPITQIQILGNILTVTAANSFSFGQSVTFKNVGVATFLNGKTVSILTASPTQFTATYNHGNYGPLADTGTANGTSGATVPSFSGTVGGTTPGDGTITWTNIGYQYSTFNTVIDSNGFLQVASVAGNSCSSWVQNRAYTLGQTIIDANGYVQTVTTPGTSGVSNISNLYYPPFNETIGAHTTDGTVVWQTTSLYTWNTNVGGVTLDGSAIWVNLGPPPGLVAPRLLTAWEIKSDQLTMFETS